MTKSELFKRFWIPIKKRIPPEEEGKFVLVWNYIWEQPMIRESISAHDSAKRILEEEIKLGITNDRLFSHWMEIEKP